MRNGAFFTLFGLLMAIVSLLFPARTFAAAGFAIDKTGVRAETIRPGLTEIILPFEAAPPAGEYEITVGIEDLQGVTIGASSIRLTLDPKAKDIRLAVNAQVDPTALPGYVVHYWVAGNTVAGGDEVVEGRKSLFYAVRQVDTRLLMQRDFYAGSQGAVRVIVMDAAVGQPIAEADVTLTMGDAVVFTGKADRFGTLEATFDVPADLVGDVPFTVEVFTGDAEDRVQQTIHIQNAYKMLLTTDKPLYQPGQVIHIRTLALRKPDLQPVNGQEAVLEVEDAKGNKVFKQKSTTNEFGVSSADFQLASELNEGAYKIRVLIGDNTAEKTVTVQRYVLPKFNPVVTTDKQFYQPGDTLKGEVQTDYFFGKPVTNGSVTVTLSKFDVNFEQFAEITGKTDDNGHYQFETNLPDYFVGQPLEQGDAFVKIDVSVTDTADHEEVKTINRVVAAAPLNLVLVPESGSIVPGVENRFFIAASYPDGSPAEVMGTVTFDTGLKVQLATDASGLGDLWMTPEQPVLRAHLGAMDKSGNIADRDVEFTTEARESYLLLRTDQALYTVGDTIIATVFSNKATGAVYVDMIKDGQTFLTHALELVNGQGSLELTADVAGSVQLHAYQILPSSDIIRDTKTLYIESAEELRIDVTADQPTFLPGEEARLDFRVTDQDGHPVLAVLGIAIVDESVFALQDMQPGLEKIYFMLEQEIMTPRYEIHAYSMDAVVTDLPTIQDMAIRRETRQKAAQVLLASAENLVEFDVNVTTFAQKSQNVPQIIWEGVMQDFQKIYNAIDDFSRERKKVLTAAEGLNLLLEKKLLAPDDLIDPWGNPYRVTPDSEDFRYMTFFCLGPDEREGTDDDIWHNAYIDVYQDKSFFDWLFGRRDGGRMMRKGVLLQDLGMPMAAVPEMMVMDEVVVRSAADAEFKDDSTVAANGGGEGDAGPRIREYFPETLYVNPALLTDEQGRASIALMMADSITTWRLTSMASSLTGTLGSGTSAVRVFQDFFVDIDLPVALTQNDQVSIPIAIYNYLPGTQDVTLKLTEEDWFELVNDVPEKVVTLNSGQVDVVYFTLQVKTIGWHKLTVHAYGSAMSDAIARTIEVLPDGKRIEQTWNGRLDKDIEQTVTIPQEALADASKILVKVYPGIFSQIVEGLDSMLRMPSGCFEQTSSATYPNILVLDYMKQSGQITPEIRMKAEGFINTGYQRLLSYEVPGGGFEWFGQAPAHKILTAYGLMEFFDMAQVHEVDPNVIARTQAWLIAQQEADGSWKPTQQYLDEVAGKFTDDVMRNTAYIAWALVATGNRGDAAAKAVRYIQDGIDDITDIYTLALAANALIGYQKDDAVGLKLLETLLNKAQDKDGKLWWQADSATATYASGASADIEVTALAALAFMQAERHHDAVSKILTYLIESKDSYGTWHSTQATILAMKALLLSMQNATQHTEAEVTVYVNGTAAEGFALTPENSDVMRLLDLQPYTVNGDNQVTIKFDGDGSALYQIVSRFYLPWQAKPAQAEEPMSIVVSYDKTELVKDDVLTANVVITNHRPADANMVIVDLGVPPGFDVEAGDLAEWVGDGVITRFDLAGRQIIVYLDVVKANAAVEFSYRLTARFPVKAKTPKSTVYEYYNPDINAESQPQDIIVSEAAAM